MSYLGRSAKLSLKAQEKVSFLATAGQTSKTGLSYTPTFVEVYVNGVLLTDTTDYTATNGNSVTFTVALLLNDEVTVISLKTFTVADHYTKSDADTLLAAKATNTALALKAPIASPSFTGTMNADGLVVDGAYSYLNGLRISGLDTGNTIYQPTSDLSISTASGAISLKTSGATAISIDNAGIVTQPLQPFFYAKNTGTGSQAGDGITTNPPLFPTAVQDIGSCLNAAHNRFTAPVAGRYFFSGVPAYKQTGQDYAVRLGLNGTDLTDVIRLIGSPNSHSGVSFSVFLYLNTNDYIELNMQASGSYGYHRNNSTVANWWSGGLL